MPAILPLILSMLASTGVHVGAKRLLMGLGGRVAKAGAGKIGEIAAKQIGPSIGGFAMTGAKVGEGAADIGAMLASIGGFEVAHSVLAPDDGEGAVAQGSATTAHADQPFQVQNVALQSALEQYFRGQAEEDVELDRMLNTIVMNAPQAQRLI